MLAVDTQTLMSNATQPPKETASIGNKAAARSQVLLTSDNAVATFVGIRWDGDKVRGIRIELSDGSFKQAGGYDDGQYTLTQYRFAPGETLISARLRDSGYGYGSLREVQFQTSMNKSFNAGPGGFDHEVSLAVEGAELVGFHAWVNSDNFINALAFIVRTPPPKPIVRRSWFATRPVGNQAAGASEVDLASDTSVARVISVRSDGDKVRGIRMELRDGTARQAGGNDDVNYTLSSYTFADGETLQSLSFSSSGYGYGSLRRLQFTTSKGATFAAGPTGVDDLVAAPVSGARAGRVPRLGQSGQLHQCDRVPRHRRRAARRQPSQLFAMGLRLRQGASSRSTARPRLRSSTRAETSTGSTPATIGSCRSARAATSADIAPMTAARHSRFRCSATPRSKRSSASMTATARSTARSPGSSPRRTNRRSSTRSCASTRRSTC